MSGTDSQNRVARASGAIPAKAATASAAKQEPVASAPPAAATKHVWTGSQHLVDMGQRLATTMVNQRDFTALNQYVADSNASDPRIRNNGLSVLCGVGVRLAMILIAMRDQGLVRFSGSRLLEAAEVAYAFETDIGRVSGILNSQIKALGEILPKGKFTVGYREAATDAAEPGTNAASPMEVKVIEMPPRHSVATVERNMAGEIIRSETIESDL